MLARCQQGDLAAFGEIVKCHQRRIYNHILRMVGDQAQAEDLTQESFVRAFRKIDQFDLERRFLPWMLRIATNLTRSHFKRASRREVSWELPDWPADEAAIDQGQQASGKQTLRRLERALMCLSRKHRLPLLLHCVEGLSYEEMGQVLDAKPAALKMRVSRARARLRALLEQEEGDR